MNLLKRLTALAGVPVFILGGASILVGCSSGSADVDTAPKAEAASVEQRSVAVTVAVVQEGDLSEKLELTGSVIAWDTFSVTSEISGRVSEIHAEEGDWVREGQTLLEFDRTQRELELETRRAQLDRGMVELEFAEKRLARAEALLEKGAISQSEVDTLRERVQLAESGVEVARLSIEAMEEELEDTVVIAPATGQLTNRMVSRGEVVGPAAGLFTLIQLNPVKVLTEITEPYLAEIEAGRDVELRFDALGNQTFIGKVHRIHPEANPESGAFPLEVRLENSRRRLLPGMVARVSLRGKVFRQVLHVPLEAIVNTEGENLVFVIENGKASRRRVEILERLEGRAIVEGDLTAGAQVILQGNRNVMDSTPVRVTGG